MFEDAYEMSMIMALAVQFASVQVVQLIFVVKLVAIDGLHSLDWVDSLHCREAFSLSAHLIHFPYF